MVTDIVELILGDLPWQIALAGIIYAFLASNWKDLWKSERTRKRWCGYLIQNNRYRAIMGGALNWIDARLTPEIEEQDWHPAEPRAAWSHNLLSLFLLVALAYPILSVFAIWVHGGEPGRIGTFELLPVEPDRFWRYAPLGLIFLSTVLFVFGANTAKSSRRLALGSLALGILFVAKQVLPDGAAAVSGAFAVALVGVAGVAVAITGVVAFAVAVTGAVTLAIAVTASGAIGFGGTAASAIGGATAAAVAAVVGIVWIGERTGKPTRFLLGWVLLGLFMILAAVSFGEPLQSQLADASSIILFISILPLLNGIADFASTGLTRFCLRRGINGSVPFWSFWDLLGGAVVFILLVTAMMAIAAWVHWPDGTPLLDLGSLLTDIRANPGDYWWLYITFLTTLLPTLLHLGIALFATVFEMSPGLRAFIVDGLTEGAKGDDPKGRWALRALCLTMTVALMLPIMVFGWIIQYHGLVGTALLDMFEGIACGTGMLATCP